MIRINIFCQKSYPMYHVSIKFLITLNKRHLLMLTRPENIFLVKVRAIPKKVVGCTCWHISAQFSNIPKYILLID